VNNCKVCGGRGLVTLAVRPDSAVMMDPAESAFPSGHHENFPCPACSPQAPAEKVRLLEARAVIGVRPEHVGSHLNSHRCESLARQLASFFLYHDMITFSEKPALDDRVYGPAIELTAVLGVIDKKQVATMKERIEEHQHGFACEVAAEAREQIRNWGSDYGWDSIKKDDACRFISEAVGTTLKRRRDAAGIGPGA
jgi:hypothetical protein